MIRGAGWHGTMDYAGFTRPVWTWLSAGDDLRKGFFGQPVQTPRLPMKRNGSGDVTAALFTGHLLNSGDPADALAKTASSVYDMLRLTFEADSRELKLVESQEFFAHPAMQFGVEKL